MEFLRIRNKLLQAWLHDPLNELTADKAQSVANVPHSGINGVIIIVYRVQRVFVDYKFFVNFAISLILFGCAYEDICP